MQMLQLEGYDYLSIKQQIGMQNCNIVQNYQLQGFVQGLMKNSQWESQSGVTHRISTFKRNNKAATGGQEEYIAYLARIRLVEDELLTEKIKNESLQRKIYDYAQTIAHLEFSLGQLRAINQKTQLQLCKHLQLDRQVDVYSNNLREVGQQLCTLNQILQKKNKECQKLNQTTTNLKQANAQLQQKIKSNQNKKQLEKRKLRQLLEQFGNDLEPSFSDQLVGDIDLLEEAVTELKDNLNKTKSALEKYRKESSDLLMRQKQKIISLQYSLKLAEKRNQDLEKKKVLESSFSVDKKIEDMIEELLKKEEELNMRITELEGENQLLREELDTERSSHSHIVQLRKSDFEKQLKQAKETIKQLVQEKTELSEKLEQVSSYREMESSRMVSEEVELSRKYRQFCEENKRLKLKINELESDKKMLEKELSLRNSN